MKRVMLMSQDELAMWILATDICSYLDEAHGDFVKKICYQFKTKKVWGEFIEKFISQELYFEVLTGEFPKLRKLLLKKLSNSMKTCTDREVWFYNTWKPKFIAEKILEQVKLLPDYNDLVHSDYPSYWIEDKIEFLRDCIVLTSLKGKTFVDECGKYMTKEGELWRKLLFKKPCTEAYRSAMILPEDFFVGYIHMTVLSWKKLETDSVNHFIPITNVLCQYAYRERLFRETLDPFSRETLIINAGLSEKIVNHLCK